MASTGCLPAATDAAVPDAVHGRLGLQVIELDARVLLEGVDAEQDRVLGPGEAGPQLGELGVPGAGALAVVPLVGLVVSSVMVSAVMLVAPGRQGKGQKAASASAMSPLAGNDINGKRWP